MVLEGRDPSGLMVDFSLLAAPAADEVYARPWIDYGPDGIFSPKAHSFHPDPYISGHEASWDQDVHNRYMAEYEKKQAAEQKGRAEQPGSAREAARKRFEFRFTDARFLGGEADEFHANRNMVFEKVTVRKYVFLTVSFPVNAPVDVAFNLTRAGDESGFMRTQYVGTANVLGWGEIHVQGHVNNVTNEIRLYGFK
jgi:hypothetical protein